MLAGGLQSLSCRTLHRGQPQQLLIRQVPEGRASRRDTAGCWSRPAPVTSRAHRTRQQQVLGLPAAQGHTRLWSCHIVIHELLTSLPSFPSFSCFISAGGPAAPLRMRRAPCWGGHRELGCCPDLSLQVCRLLSARSQ